MPEWTSKPLEKCIGIDKNVPLRTYFPARLRHPFAIITVFSTLRGLHTPCSKGMANLCPKELQNVKKSVQYLLEIVSLENKYPSVYITKTNNKRDFIQCETINCEFDCPREGLGINNGASKQWQFCRFF